MRKHRLRGRGVLSADVALSLLDVPASPTARPSRRISPDAQTRSAGSPASRSACATNRRRASTGRSARAVARSSPMGRTRRDGSGCPRAASTRIRAVGPSLIFSSLRRRPGSRSPTGCRASTRIPTALAAARSRARPCRRRARTVCAAAACAGTSPMRSWDREAHDREGEQRQPGEFRQRLVPPVAFGLLGHAPTSRRRPPASRAVRRARPG